MKFYCLKYRVLILDLILDIPHYFPIITCFRCEWKTSKFGVDESSAFLDNVKFTPGKCGYLCPTGYVKLTKCNLFAII